MDMIEYETQAAADKIRSNKHDMVEVPELEMPAPGIFAKCKACGAYLRYYHGRYMGEAYSTMCRAVVMTPKPFTPEVKRDVLMNKYAGGSLNERNHMIVHCSKCHEDYNDTYRDTSCPHDPFNMHTHIMVEGTDYVATSIEDLQAIQDHYHGIHNSRFVSIHETAHQHRKIENSETIQCLSPKLSGRLEYVS